MRQQRIAWCGARAGVLGILVTAVALGGCANLLHLPQMPWTAHNKAVQNRPSPYAPVAVGPPITPPAINTGQYGDSLDRVVASVDGNPITEYELRHPNPGAGGVNSLSGNGTGLDSQAILKQLIAQQLLDDEAQKFTDRVDDADVERYIQALETRDHVTDAQLRSQLQSQGMSYDDFRKAAFNQVAAITMIDREIREKIHISDSQIEAYYKAHPDQFTVTDEKYRLAQILIAVPSDAPAAKVAAAQSKADKVRALAVQGKDFAQLARQYSDDDSKNKGGELGYFNPTDLNDQIAAAIKALSTGDISPVIHTRYGFHIIKVEEHQRPGEQSLAAVKEQIRNQLVNDEAKARFTQWVEHDLAKQHDVETMN